jgi:hypothetical protein
VRNVNWLTVDLKILKAVMERIANQGMKAEALQSSTSGQCAAWAVRIVQINPEVAWSQRKETLEKVVLWISSSDACSMDSSGKAVCIAG